MIKGTILGNQNIFSEDFMIFFNSVVSFLQQKIGINKIAKLLEIASATYLLIPNAKYVSFFSINRETFLFDHIATNPSNKNSVPNFEKLTNNGTIGRALQNGSLVVSSLEESENIQFIIIPMINLEGIIGIVLVSTDSMLFELEVSQINAINLFTSYISSAIGELLFAEKETKLNSLVDQMVASRTIALQQEQMQLGDKMNMMTTNLLMALPHEVRTPINQILGLTNFLKNYYNDDAEGNADTIEMLNDISSATDRLRSLLENYLFYANLVILANDINELLAMQNKTMETCEPFIYETVFNYAHTNNRQDDIKLNLIDAHICIAEKYFIKIVEELIVNAIKFSSPGDKILVNSYISGDKYYLRIKDHGVGIDSHQVKNFGPYVQFERNVNEQQGSGFGLSIVAKILDIYKGELKIQGVKDEYTEATISFNIFNESTF